MKSKPSVKFQLFPKQRTFLNLLESLAARYVLYVGGVGAGKSRALIYAVFRLVVKYPGIVILVTDSNWPSLRDSTYQDFIDLVPDSWVKQHNRSTHTFRFNNSSRVIFRAFDDPNKLKRYNFGAICAEELTEIRHDIFKMARTRMRQPNMPCIFFGATNASTRSNWVYKAFIDPLTKLAHSAVVHCTTADNPFLPDEFKKDMDSLANTDSNYHARMVLAEWGELSGLCYPLPASLRKVPREILKQADKVICGVDFGYVNPTAISVIAVKNEHFYIIAEHYETNLHYDDLKRMLHSLDDVYEFDHIYGDSARPDLIAQLADDQEHPLPIVPGRKGPGSVFAGIMFIKGLIGSSRLAIDAKNCTNHLEEIDNYVWATKRGEDLDEPVKKNDHACDAFRYAIHTYCLDNAGSAPSVDKMLETMRIVNGR